MYHVNINQKKAKVAIFVSKFISEKILVLGIEKVIS